jgi:hypothetical protein
VVGWLLELQAVGLELEHLLLEPAAVLGEDEQQEQEQE